LPNKGDTDGLLYPVEGYIDTITHSKVW